MYCKTRRGNFAIIRIDFDQREVGLLSFDKKSKCDDVIKYVLRAYLMMLRVKKRKCLVCDWEKNASCVPEFIRNPQKRDE